MRLSKFTASRVEVPGGKAEHFKWDDDFRCLVCERAAADLAFGFFLTPTIGVRSSM